MRQDKRSYSALASQEMVMGFSPYSVDQKSVLFPQAPQTPNTSNYQAIKDDSISRGSGRTLMPDDWA